MPVHRRSGLIVCLLLAVLLSACSGTDIAPASQPDPDSPRFEAWPDPLLRSSSAAGLPALPAPPSLSRADILARRSSTVFSTVLRGSEFSDAAGLGLWNTPPPWELDESGHQVTLQPQSGQLSWALYAFRNLLPEDNPNSVLLDISGLLPAHYYAALADYASGRWQLSVISRSEGRDTLPLLAADGSPIQPLAPDGTVYVLLASFDSVALTIDRVELALDTPAPPPGGLKVVQVDGVMNFEVSWTEPDFAYEAVQVERRADYFMNDIHTLSVPAGTSSIIDHPLNGDADIVLPGARISYRLRTVVNGRAGPAGPPVEVYRVPEEASNLSASSEEPFTITLNWDPGGSQWAEVYRDSLDAPLTIIQSDGSWTDETLNDYEDHQYWLKPYITLPWLEDTPPVYLPTLGPVTGTLRKRPYITWVSLSAAQSGQNLSASAIVYGPGTFTYAWDFDDATTPATSTDAQPTVTCGPPVYTRPALTVSNAHGSDVYFFDLLITAGPRPWMQFKYDPQNSGYVPWAGTSVGEELWVYDSGAEINGDAVLGLDGTVYAANIAGELHAINPDGSPKWVLDLGAKIECAPLVAPSGDIFVASDALYCVSPAGALRWSNPAGKGKYCGHPNILPDGSIACEGQVISASGELLGSFQPGGNFAGGKAVSPSGRLLTGGDNMHCMDEVQRELWTFGIGTNDSVPALRSDGSALIGSYMGLLSCVDASGELLWDYDAGFYHSIYGSPACAPDGTIAYVAYDHIEVLEGDGTLRWSLPADSEVWAGPAIDSAGKIYFCTYGSGVVLCNEADGSSLWSLDIGSFITATPSIGLDGTVYACNRAGEVWAIGDAP